MKKILLGILLSLSMQSWAVETPSNSIALSAGVLSPYGMLGISYERLLNENNGVQASIGIDPIGTITSVGYRYYLGTIGKAPGIWGKCLFLFECDSAFFGGLSLQYASSSLITFREDEIESKYRPNGRFLVSPTIGIRTLYSSGFTAAVFVSYRELLTETSLDLDSGPGVSDAKKSIDDWSRGTGIGVSLGYSF